MSAPDPVFSDRLADQMRSAAILELRWALHDLTPEGLTALEIVAMLAVLRTARERVEAEQAPPAQLTLLRPKSTRRSNRGTVEPRAGRNRKQPARV
jgi:hypothetical protein